MRCVPNTKKKRTEIWLQKEKKGEMFGRVRNL
jgi:hypothetical protein